MIVKKTPKFRLVRVVFGVFLMMGIIGGLIFSGILNSQTVYAEPIEAVTVDETTSPMANIEESESQGIQNNIDASCKNSLGEVGWRVCPMVNKIAEAVDWLYGKIENILIINPVPAEDGSPIYEIWKYCRGLTNVVFIIFLLVVIYSQITGLGISNYGLKRALPKLVIAAVLVNLSFLICSLAVDVSNIVGNGLRGVFTSIAESAVVPSATSGLTANGDLTREMKLSYAKMYSSLAGGTALAIGGGLIAFESGAIWMLIPVVLGAIVSVVSGLVTIALRQAVVALLIMISPLAMVAYILPNTEQWFKKWKDLLYKMLIFYPMFSLLFGASQLAGFAIIASAKDGFGVLLGMAVQIFPLFFSWSLMKMSGTFLSNVNTRIRGLAAKPLAANRAWAESRRQLTRAYNMEYGITPYSRLRRKLDNRKALREHTTASLQTLRKNNASIYVQRKIAAGYDGGKTKTTDGDFTPNKYTKIAKDLSNSVLEGERTRLDTEHVISNYGSYYVKKALRDSDKYNSERRGLDADTLQAMRESDSEYRRSKRGGNEYLELYRAQITREHDSEADVEFATSVFGKVIPKNATQADYDRYNHYILSSAGGLGDNRTDRVRGKILARAAGVENTQRRDIAYLGAKYAVPKYPLRNMLVGYHHNSDGYAINRNGEVIEAERGYLLNHDPSKLWWWENVDPVYGPYFDWLDENGNFITRVYKTNSPAMKELLSNFDIPINDPVNNLFSILTGINGDPNAEDVNMRFVGLGKLKTTLSRSLGIFKEKNAAYSPMLLEMLKEGTIKNSTDLHFACLDSLNKATKPGNFNNQDNDAIEMDIKLLNKDLWKEVFNPKELKFTENIDKKRLSGLDYDEEGNEVKIPPEQSSYEQLLRTIEKKHAAPFAVKAIAMMARITPSTLDNQKIGTLTQWSKLANTIEEYWLEEVKKSGYYNELRKVKRRFNDRINGRRDNSGSNTDDGIDLRTLNEDVGESRNRNEFSDRDNRERIRRVNPLLGLDRIYNESIDGVSFIDGVNNYCNEHNLEEAAQEFCNQIDDSMTIDELYRIAVNVFGHYMD